ncbi:MULTISPECIES: hypothetical protein [unclassified Stenotrophomonas]|uniref:hypothetical protein n=1 Tax=unclassified Stenotrophomonas TaxID=196198 RepID=UPI0012FEEDD8|nr:MULTISPECIES: hypothetical protein [unclassified Stenotrophomonas]
MPVAGSSSQTTPALIRGRHPSGPVQGRATASTLGSLLVGNTAPLRVRRLSAPSGPRRVSAENYPPVAGSADAMRQTTTLRALYDQMDEVRRALQSGRTGAGRRSAALESSLLRRSVDANMPALIPASEAEWAGRMVSMEFQRGGPGGLRDSPFFQSTPSRAHSLESLSRDAPVTCTREIGGLRRVQGNLLLAGIQNEDVAAVAGSGPSLFSIQRGALLPQLSGEAVQGVDQRVHLFHPDADSDAEGDGQGPAAARAWTGAGSRPAALVCLDDADWRVKETGDTGLSAMEASLSRVFQLTGLAAPDARVMAADASLPGDSQRFASRYEPSFKDLGSFLATPAAEALAAAGDEEARMRYAQLRSDHAAAVSTCDAVLQRAGVAHFWQVQDAGLQAEHAAADRQRFDALEAMNRLLPTAVRSDQVRHFIASRWLGNWDHLNFRMENFGYAERDGQPVAMTVDFGSCGPLGFATLDARRVMLPKQASGDIAMLQRPASLFPIPDAFVENAAEFDAMGADPGRLHDTLGWPYGFQSESVAELMRAPAAPDPAIADAMAEMGYRLALVPAMTVHAVVGAGWQVPAGAPQGHWPDAARMASTLVQRRQALLAQYAPAQIRDWISADPERAARVRQQMLDGIGAALGGDADPTVLQEHSNALHAGHQMLLDGDLAAVMGDATAHAPNATTARIRTLQQLHDCNRRLAAALDTNEETDIRAIGEELLSPLVFGQLLRDLELGPGSDVLGHASFEANRDWLLLLTRLVDAGHLDATRVTRCLLEPFEGSAYPPNVGAHAHRDPALGMAFIELLETLIARSAEITPTMLREGLLTAKEKGYPNYYAALAASGASTAWDRRLQLAELLPGNAEYIRLRSWRSWAAKKLSYAPRRGDEPIRIAADAGQRSALPLRALVQHVEGAYGVRRIIELELQVIRANLHMKLTSHAEDQALQALVQDSVEGAWKEALAKHRLPRNAPVPPGMIETLKGEALDDYRIRMRNLRKADAELRVQAGERRYTDAVLAQPGLSLPDRRRLLKQCAAEIEVDIRNMVRDAGDTGNEALHAVGIGQRAQQHAAATAGDMAARAAAQAQRDAQAQAEQQTRSKAGESAQRASARAAGSATRAAALTASSQANAQASAQAQATAHRQAERRAAAKAASEASARATRDAIVQNRGFRNEVETRLAMLRSPDVAGGSTSAVRHTDAQLERRLHALRQDSATAALEQRLRALREGSPRAGAAPASRPARQRTRQYVDPHSGASGSTT